MEIIHLGAGSDTIRGSARAETIRAGIGDDLVRLSTGGDSLSGGAGRDRLDTIFVPGAVRIDLAAGSVTLPGGSATIDGFEDAAAGVAGDAVLGKDAANTIWGRAGNDTLDGRGGADVLNGGLGDDWIADSGTGAADRLLGGDGADTLVGGAADVLNGGMGNDLFRASDGAVVLEAAGGGTDTVQAMDGTTHALRTNVEVLVLEGPSLRTGIGNSLDNLVIGNGAGNWLLGMAGNDRLRGEGGNDVLVGGAGADTLHGGAGTDLFRFLSIADSGVANPDFVAGFTFSAGGGFDRIDLRAIDANALLAGAQDFAFIGSAAFSGSAGQIRVTADGTGRWIASGDVTGDGVADFAIRIEAATAPVAGWFLL